MVLSRQDVRLGAEKVSFHLMLGAAFSAALLVRASPSLAEQHVISSNPTAIAGRVVEAFDRLFEGPHDGYRAVHAKGVVLYGSFAPTSEAAHLSKAEHFRTPSSPVVVRFSNFAGVPTLADADGAASPHGMAIKFLLPDGGSTDIVAHSYDGFPASTPEEFVAFLGAVHSSDPTVLPAYLADHPAAKRFIEAPKPVPASYADETFFGVNAFRFTNASGAERYGKYRLEPLDGHRYLTSEEASGRAPDFLRAEMSLHLAARPVRFRLLVQLADPSDTLTDAALPWPTERQTIEIGTLTLDEFPSNQDVQNQSLFFTPLNLVAGIEPSTDPMLVSRNRAYRLSYNRRHDGEAGRRQASTDPLR